MYPLLSACCALRLSGGPGDDGTAAQAHQAVQCSGPDLDVGIALGMGMGAPDMDRD